MKVQRNRDTWIKKRGEKGIGRWDMLGDEMRSGSSIKNYRDLVVWQKSMAFVTQLQNALNLVFRGQTEFVGLYDKSRGIERMISAFIRDLNME